MKFILLILSNLSLILYGQVIDHKCTAIQNIPVTWIDRAKSTLHIAYEHTSHGSQLTDGMTGLYNWKGSVYAFNKGGSGGALDISDYAITGGSDLGNPDFTSWASSTRIYLNKASNSNINVIIWAWCGQLSNASSENVNTYLSLMSSLETDYPAVKFVYMTGHLDGTGINGNLNLRNNQIRDYCKNNNKILYDFADIESYDPDGVYYGDKYPTEACNYDFNKDGVTSQEGDPATPTNGDKNWALDWQNTHTVNIDWYNCGAAHSQTLNANRKAYAAWWLWAILAGWNGGSAEIPVTGITITFAGSAPAITINNGSLQVSAVLLPANATNTSVTWSITNGTGQAVINNSGLVTAVYNGTVTARATANDGSGVYGTLIITNSNQIVPVTSITVTGAGEATSITTDNGTLQLSTQVLPANATNKTVTWSLVNGTGEATINSSGLVTAADNGTVTARATANDGSGVYGTLIITNSNQVVPITSITVTGEGGATNITTDDGTLQLVANVLPVNATDKNVIWSIFNSTGQASISSTGLVTAIENGIVIARAMDDLGLAISGTLVITISNQVRPVTGITVTGAGGLNTIATNSGTLQLSAEVLPADATEKTVTWSIVNGTGRATINSNGLVTAFANGTVTAKATAIDGSGVNNTITISISGQIVLVTSITVTGAGGVTNITTGNGTLLLSAAVSPSDATEKTVTWSIINGTGQATIGASGLVTAAGNGTVTARATGIDGSGVFGTLIINIINQKIPVNGISVTGAGGANSISSNKVTLQLIATVLPPDATDKTVIWSINNGTGEATISDAGLVTALADGTVTAIATARDNAGIYGTLAIAISDLTRSLTGDNEPLKIIVTSYEMKILLYENNFSWKADLYNLQGRLLMSKLADSEIVAFDISSLTSGIYIVVLSYRDRLKVSKVIKP